MGWSVSSVNEVEFAAAAAAGATRVRVDACEWSSVEEQTVPPNNASLGYSLQPGCATGLAYAKKYGLQPTLVAAYGSPLHQILTLKLTAAAVAGATTIQVEYLDGVGGDTLSSLSYPYDYLTNASNNVAKKNSYGGVLVAGIVMSGKDTAKLTLASSLRNALPAGSILTVNEALYPSPMTARPTEASIVAYGHYAQYLAEQIKAYGLKGEVELWNEPTWGADCWDNRRNCYDSDPKISGELYAYAPNFGFAAVLQKMAAVSGVSYVWAGTNKSGNSDLLYTNMLATTGNTYIQSQQSVTSESFHPYGSNPEDAMWSEPCVRASTTVNQAQTCNLTRSSANFVSAEGRNVLAKACKCEWCIKHSITETGASHVVYAFRSHGPFCHPAISRLHGR